MKNETDSEAVRVIDHLFPPLFRSLCRYPNECQVEMRHSATASTIWVRPHDDDFGLLLGTGVKTFRSFQTICRAISDRTKHRIVLEKLQGGRPMDAAKKHWPAIAVKADFDIRPIHRLVIETVQAFTKMAAFDVSKDGSCWRITVTVSSDEPARGDLEIESALTTIMNAAAKIQGGDVRVCYVRSGGQIVETPEEPQPETAAGRYAEET